MKSSLCALLLFCCLQIGSSLAMAQVRFGECISMKSMNQYNCRPEEQVDHVRKTFQWETRNVVENLKTLCASPADYNISNLSFTEIAFSDGPKQLIFPLAITPKGSCNFESCKSFNVHFLAMERGKIVYAQRQISMDSRMGPQWMGKDNRMYGFTTFIAPDQQEFFQGSPLTGGATATLCEGFDQAQNDEKFIADTQNGGDVSKAISIEPVKPNSSPKKPSSGQR